MEAAVRKIAESKAALDKAKAEYRACVAEQFKQLPADEKKALWFRYCQKAAEAGKVHYNGRLMDTDVIPHTYGGEDFEQ